jgi:hypothetical protein
MHVLVSCCLVFPMHVLVLPFPGLVPLSEVSLAEPLGRTVRKKSKRMATRDRASCFLRVFDSPRELWLLRLMPGG